MPWEALDAVREEDMQVSKEDLGSSRPACTCGHAIRRRCRFCYVAVILATCLALLRQHGLLDGFCHMRALLGLVEVDVDTYVEYQRQDENHMGDSTPRRTPALGRLQPKSVFSIMGCKV